MADAGGAALPVLDLPESEFVYLAGTTDRPWDHFTGRWRAISGHLRGAFGAGEGAKALRLVDVGSCTGYFSLQAAHCFANAQVIGVEGSVGVGNGAAGQDGNAAGILHTPAVQTHLKWIEKLGLPNCRVAPEVWDYARVCELAAKGPIADATFLLSVIHHIDGVSHEQYAQAGLTRTAGVVDLISKLLKLAPMHFVELPDRPWIACAYDAHGTQRGVLQAAADASGLGWRFVGPICAHEWFGRRELWVLEAEAPMASPLGGLGGAFPTLFAERGSVPPAPAPAPARPASRTIRQTDGLDILEARLGQSRLGLAGLANGGLGDNVGLGGGLNADAYTDYGGINDYGGKDIAELGGDWGDLAGSPYADPLLSAAAIDECGPAEHYIGEALGEAPTSLLVAHLSLREAITEAEDLLDDLRAAGAEGGSTRRRVAEREGGAGPAQRGAAAPRAVAR